jgi:hypothetical protein
MKNKHFIRNKKGTDKLGIALAILGVVVILVFLFFLNDYYTTIKEKMEVQNCKNSIAAHSMLASGSDYEIFTDIKCPTRYITVSTNDFTKAKSQIAEDMTRCWYEWNEGKGPYFKGDGTFCHICSVYTFKPANQNINGFIKYLSSESPKFKLAGAVAGGIKGITYMDYFQGYKSPSERQLVSDPAYKPLSDKDDLINTTNKYATVFIYISGKDTIQEFLEGKKAGATTAGSVAVILGVAAVAKGTIALGGVIGALATGAAVNFWNPVGWIAGGAAVIAVASYAIYEIWNQDDPEWISLITFKPYNAAELNALGCEKSEVNQLSHSTP